MSDRTILRIWWVTTISLIAMTAMGALLALYNGVFSALSGAYGRSGREMLIGSLLGTAAYFLSRYRGDLVGD